jgi:hypothetical protein
MRRTTQDGDDLLPHASSGSNGLQERVEPAPTA